MLPLGGRPVQVQPGYGITIVPLRNISATSAAQFIQPLVASPEDIRIDPGRNAILFSGTGVERQNVLQTLQDLDVDWMAGKSIGLFPLQRANAEALIPELQAIFAPFDPTGAEPSLVRFMPLARHERRSGDRRRSQQVREVGAWVNAPRPWPGRGHPVLCLLSQARRRRGRCQAAQRGVQRFQRQLVRAKPGLGSRAALSGGQAPPARR